MANSTGLMATRTRERAEWCWVSDAAQISKRVDELDLIPVVPQDVMWVSRVIDRWDCTTRWGGRGRTPSPSLLQHLLWDEVAAQRSVKGADGTPAGLLQLVDIDFHNGIGRMAALLDRDRRSDLMKPIASFVEFAFRDFPLRKICAIAADDRFDPQAYLGPGARTIGCFRAHDRRGDGIYVDVSIHEMWRNEVTVGPA